MSLFFDHPVWVAVGVVILSGLVQLIPGFSTFARGVTDAMLRADYTKFPF